MAFLIFMGQFLKLYACYNIGVKEMMSIMNKLKMLPVGYEDFSEIRTDNFYYVDKTKLIEQIFDNKTKVSLFTRPRRFGKSLNMSMLKYFFKVDTDKSLFDGLYISNNKELCDKYMGKYPVVSITLKNVEGLNYEAAKINLKNLYGWKLEILVF